MAIKTEGIAGVWRIAEILEPDCSYMAGCPLMARLCGHDMDRCEHCGRKISWRVVLEQEGSGRLAIVGRQCAVKLDGAELTGSKGQRLEGAALRAEIKAKQDSIWRRLEEAFEAFCEDGPDGEWRKAVDSLPKLVRQRGAYITAPPRYLNQQVGDIEDDKERESVMRRLMSGDLV